MPYIAYDPDRLAALTGAMRAALDELGRLQCDDPSAAGAISAVRLAHTHLDQMWIPFINGLVSSDPLGGAGTSVRLDSGDLVDQLMRLMQEQFGWVIGAPIGLPLLDAPTGPIAPPSPEETMALADALQHGDIHHLVDDASERQFLATQLTAIGADPALAALFDQHFERWGELGDQLGQVRVLATAGEAPDTAVVGDIDQTFKGIAAISTAVHGSGSIPQVSREMVPYSAAVLVAQASVDADMLPWLSVEILHRYIDGHPPLRWEDLYPGPKTADILFQTILATEGAPARFVILASDDPEVLWWTAADARLAQQVAAVGTDPANITDPEAHIVMHSFVNWFSGSDTLYRNEFPYVELPDNSSRAYLGALAAPWLVEFGPANGPWGTDYTSRADDLRFILRDGGARDAMVARMEDLSQSIYANPTAEQNDAIASTVGLLSRL